MPRQFHLLALLILMAFSASQAFAVSGKVLKIKGNKAIVQFEKGDDILPGQVVNTSSSDAHYSPGEYSKRRYSLLYAANYTTAAARVNVTKISANGTFGINFGKYEVGPILSFTSYSSTPGGSSSTVDVGGFGHYNMIFNRSDEEWIPVIGGKVLLSSGNGATTTYFGGYIGAHWFLLSNNVAFWFEGDLGSRSGGGSSAVVYGGSAGPAVWW